MKKLSLLLLIAGLLAGPAYWVYAKFYTGSQAGLLSLSHTSGADGPVWRSPAFNLSPDMAPLGLILLARGKLTPEAAQGRPPQDSYHVTLFQDGTPAEPLRITLKVKNTSDISPLFREHLVLFQVVKTGSYQLEVAPEGAPRLPLDQVQLELRRNLMEPDSQVVMAGLLALMLGILGLVLL